MSRDIPSRGKPCWSNRLIRIREANDSFIVSEVSLESDQVAARIDSGSPNRCLVGGQIRHCNVGVNRKRRSVASWAARTWIGKRCRDVTKDNRVIVLSRLRTAQRCVGAVCRAERIAPDVANTVGEQEEESLRCDHVTCGDSDWSCAISCGQAAPGEPSAEQEAVRLEGDNVRCDDACRTRGAVRLARGQRVLNPNS